MPDGHKPNLPFHRPARPEHKDFPIGAAVWLVSCPCGEPGRVEGVRFGRVLVRWHDIGYVGKHRAEALVLVEDKKKEATREAV
jgi:hypothetical protein